VTDHDDPRPAHQFFIALSAAVADALTAAALREDRPIKRQAVRYVVDGLRRDGYLPPDRDAEPDAER
jgi:hypothetical protein